MVEQYGWVVVTVIISLVGLYSTIMGIKDRNNKPIETLKENLVTLEKSVVQLITTLNNTNDTFKETCEKNDEIHKDLVNSITECSKQLINHEIRISNVEQEIDNLKK